MNTLLPFGNFIGIIRREVKACSFSFAEVLDVREEEIPKHTHEDAHFLFILQGAYITSARNVDQICPPSTLIFNPAGTTHRDRFYNRGGRFFTVSVCPESLKRVHDEVDLIDYSTGLHDGQTWLLVSKLYKESRLMDKLSPLVMEGLAIELLAHTARQKIRLDKTSPRWLQTAYELIRDRCAESITVSEIAGTVGVHPFHLTRTFRKFFRTTPGEFLRSCRLQKASELLRHSRLSLADIALECGFSDQSQFTKSFKRSFGLPPAEFRKLFG